MAARQKKLGEILLSHRLLTEGQLEQALALQRTHPVPLGQIVVRRGWLSEKQLLSALAAQRSVSAWHLEEDPPAEEAVKKLPPDVCRKLRALPVAVRGSLLLVAMARPEDIEVIDLLRNLTGMRIEPVMANESRLTAAIEKLNSLKPVEARSSMDGLVRQALANTKDVAVKSKQADRADLAEEETRPVVGLVNQILTDAIRRRASDVHFEPKFDRLEVRLRVDGQMEPLLEVPLELVPMLTTRVKIMAEVDIVEFRIPQDGRITVELDGRNVDLRVSVLPNYHGQRIVMRILDQATGVKNLDDLGFTRENLGLFRTLISQPYGLFLVSGPTGSGKTTTLYAGLQEILTGRNNIMTCEDPVEYDLEGINQSQVNDKVGLTFASQLRAILRQDPDVILVGEIRDPETAETAMRAAMTGHLVLSTLHCNDAPRAIPRLLDLDVDPYLLSTTLIGSMGQRLVRTLCPSCRATGAPTEEEALLLRSQFGAEDVPLVGQAVGCADCRGTGYRGRMAVHEVMPVTTEISKLVADRASVELVKECAGGYGYRTMQDDALHRISDGRTTVAEVKRVLAFDVLERQPARVGPARLRAA